MGMSPENWTKRSRRIRRRLRPTHGTKQHTTTWGTCSPHRGSMPYCPGPTHLNWYMREGRVRLRWGDGKSPEVFLLSLIHISEPTRLGMISYAVFCLKKKKEHK